jgi:cyclophilin family peptidyl-prolyl cis-trans isomerase/HEAT repeat protein
MMYPAPRGGRIVIQVRRFSLLTAWVILTVIVLHGACRTRDGVAPAIARAEDLRVSASPVLVKALADGTVEERVRAAVAMGRIQDDGYTEALATATHDTDIEVHRAALFALGQLGLAEGARPSQAAVDACLDSLESDDADVVATAVEALGNLAPDVIAPTITSLLQHESDAVRAEAANALFRLRFVPVWRRQALEPPLLPEPSVQALSEALSDPSVLVRRASAHAFSRYGEPDAVDSLETGLKDDDEWVRLFSARALGRSDRTDSLPHLVALLDDESAHVRVEAVNAIVVLGGVHRLPAELSRDASHHVRAALAYALADGHDDREIATLRTLEQDTSPTVAAAAIGSLARRLGSAYVEALAAHLEDSRWVIRVAAADGAALLESGGRSLLDVAWADSNNSVRLAALGGLARTPDGGQFLQQALAEDDLAVRGTAVGLLLASEDDPATALQRLGSAYDASAGIEWVEVRESIVDAVAASDAGADAEALLGRIAAGDAEYSVRRRASVALREKGLEPAKVGEDHLEPSPFLDRHFKDDPVVVIETDKGTLRLRCLAEQAPIHVASFVKLVEQGHYDDLPWHRVVPNFVIQGGDPRGDGWGGAGYLLRDEINRIRYERGTVGMPKAGKDTGGGQLFITHVPTPHLDGNYTVFARVTSGVEVVDRIEVGDRILRAYVESGSSE